MLQTNLQAAVNIAPVESHFIIFRIAHWARKHHKFELIDPRVIATDLGIITQESLMALSMALHALVKAGLYRIGYRVVEPSGELNENDFEDPNDIPDSLIDGGGNEFTTNCTCFVVVLKPVTTAHGAKTVS